MMKKQSTDIPNLIKEYSIFIDTSSLMRSQAQDFLMQKISPYLKIENKKLVLMKEVTDELFKIKEDKKKQQPPEKRLEAKKGYETCLKLINEECANHMGKSSSVNYADNFFLVKFTEERYKRKLCLITQDKKLSNDILDLNESSSSGKAKGIKVFSLHKAEGLKEYFLSEPKKSASNSDKLTNVSIKKPAQIKPLFSDNTKLIDIKQTKSLKIEASIKSKDEVFDESGKNVYLIGNFVGSGAEGTVYSISNMNSKTISSRSVCKIYSKDMLDNHRLEKLQLMVKNQISSNGICWPRSILYTSKNEPVGFIMNKAEGYSLKRSLFAHPKIFEEKLPSWDRANLVKVCLNILNAVNLLHKNNVLLGDINGSNIMVNDKCETFIVDADSFQIEGYPCPVGSPEYTAPEIQKMKFGTFLRTKNNEYFSLGTLLFMILMCGKHPYSSVDGGMVTDNIKNSQFPYPFGSKDSASRSVFDLSKPPPGPWRKIWSHIPFASKQSFFNCFARNERLDGISWSKILQKYHKILEKGADDPESYAIIPEDYKVVPQDVIDKFKNDKQEKK